MNGLNDEILIAFDLETTGLYPVEHKIIEIGAVKFQGEQILGTFESLINPEISIPKDVTRIHGISDEMVENQPTIQEILPVFLDFIEDDPLIIHNAPFDLGFLLYEVSQYGRNPLRNRVLDTCRLARQFIAGAPNYKLETLVTFLNIPQTKFHRALADAMYALGIFLECIKALPPDLGIDLNEMVRISADGYSLIKMDIGYVRWPKGFESLKEAMELGSSVRITYGDAQGKVTKREITPLILGSYRGAVHIEAFCHLRREKRNFRFDRIISVEAG